MRSNCRLPSGSPGTTKAASRSSSLHKQICLNHEGIARGGSGITLSASSQKYLPASFSGSGCGGERASSRSAATFAREKDLLAKSAAMVSMPLSSTKASPNRVTSGRSPSSASDLRLRSMRSSSRCFLSSSMAAKLAPLDSLA